MNFFGGVEWRTLLLPSTPLLEIVVRGSVMYLVLFWLLRFVLKRVAGTVGMADLLMVVLIADAAQNALADDYRSIVDGVVLVITIVFWNYLLDWIGYRFPRFQRFFHPPPLPLVRDGHLLRQNMRQELITLDELMSQLRQQGIEDVEQVKSAAMEGDGRISVIGYDGQRHGARERRLS